jgi:hypothetical protein
LSNPADTTSILAASMKYYLGYPTITITIIPRFKP